LRVAELTAEAAGVDYGTFEKEVGKSLKKTKKLGPPAPADTEQDMNKMLMSNKQRKLYERMKYGENKKAAEVFIRILLLER
jgi:pescadillo protein